MPRGWLSAHWAGLAGAGHAVLPVAFGEHTECRDSDGHNCFCRGGEHCIQPTKGGEGGGGKGQAYALGCEGTVDGEEALLLDGFKKGLKGARCISEFSPNMTVTVKDGHETISMKIDGEEAKIIPRYPMRLLSKKYVANLLKLNTGDILIPPSRLHKRDDWVKLYKDEMRSLYEDAMKKVHTTIEKVAASEGKGEDEPDPEKEANGSAAGALFGEVYASLKSECDRVADIAQKICGKDDHCQPLKCFRGEEEEQIFRRYNQIIFESMDSPGKHGVRRGLKEAGIDDETIDRAAADSGGVSVQLASQGLEAGGKVSSEEEHFTRESQEGTEGGVQDAASGAGNGAAAKEPGEGGGGGDAQEEVQNALPAPLLLLCPLLKLPRVQRQAGAARACATARRSMARRFL